MLDLYNKINKSHPIHSYGILVINTQAQLHVITKIPYSLWGVSNIKSTYHISRNIGEHYIWWFAQKMLLAGF